ncbi:MAG: Gfo/Idh/MocA family oxidoreductase [Hamadaea sp.]|uniref:Gfo/Idh/MocA family protein n=1 Tax=Hamadaea sp. TaxID=2024425 RepID=UPI001793ADE8|nr:Gfo/Idh/MocA family oxidoreductase [Hamadaea sp.]NUT20814.1 Gfo/Idh/MocA family oxidoreductase [Hamadaea sp.]
MIRVAVAGLGAIARTAHLPMLARRSDLFSVAAVSDLSPTALAEFDVPAYADAADMIAAGGFDAILLLTSGSHGELAGQALAAGLPVFCEKPLALTRAEVAQLPEADRLMVGYMKQYDPAVERALEELDRIGGPAAVHHVDVSVLHPSGDSQLAFAHLPTFSDVPASAVALLRARDGDLVRAAVGDDPGAQGLYRILVNSLSHDLSLLRLFTGAPATVDHATTWVRKDVPEPSVEVTGDLPEGGRFTLHWHYLPDYPAYRETVTLHHERGSLELVFPSPYLMNAPTQLTIVDGAFRSVFTSVDEAFERELVAFHSLVTSGTPPRTGAEGGLSDLITSQRIVRASAHPVSGEATSA